MAPDRDIGSVHIDVTSDIEDVKKKIQAVLASIGPLNLDVVVDKSDLAGVSTAVAAEGKKAQTKLTAAQKKGISDRRTAREKAEAAELKSQKDLNRDLVAGREKSALEIAKIQQDAAGKERVVNAKRKADHQAAEDAITANIVSEGEKRDTLAKKSSLKRTESAESSQRKIREGEAATTAFIAKEEAKQLTVVEKGEGAKVAANARADGQIKAGKGKLADDLVRLDTAGKERQERTRFTFQQRELLAQRAQQRSLELIIARSQAKMAAFGNKPIGVGVLQGLTKINSSLVEFDRVASRVLRTSLLSFTAWSAGVAAAAGAAAAVAIVSFSKFEQAVARASAVFASDQFTKGLLEGGNGLKTFSQLAEESSARVVKASNAVALTTLFNPREVAEGARALAQAGLTQKEALDKTASGYSNLATVAAFAQNEQLDFAAATEFLTGGLVSAGLEMGQLTELTDKFTTVANATNASAQQVAEAFANQGAAAFRAYGQSAEQALTVIGLLAKANERGLKAGTTAAILIREINNAAVNKAPDAFKKYGIAVGKVNGQTVPFTKTLTQLTTLFRETERREGSQGFAKLRKELGLTEKSLRGLILLTPQVAELGQPGVDRFTKIIEKSAGATQRQASVVTKTLSFQFQNLIESITIQFQNFGEAAGKSLAAVFDRFNGPGGIIKSLEPDVIRLGERFGALISRFGDFVDSPEAKQGALILLDAIKITLVGVKDTFKQFAAAFGEVENGQSTFVAFAKSVQAFAEVSATTLPIVARAIGEIINLLIENKDAFEGFAKLAVGLFIARRAFALTIVPLKALTEGFYAARTAATKFAVSSESGAIANGIGALAQQLGFVDKAAIAARNSLLELQAASAAGASARGASAATGATLVANASAKKGFTKLAGAEATANIPRLTKAQSAFSKLLSNSSKAAVDFGPKLLKLGVVVGVVVSAVEAAVGIFRGFKKGLDETLESSDDSRRGFAFLATAAKKTFSVLKAALKVILDIFGQMADTIELVGVLFGRTFGHALGTVTKFADAFVKLFNGDIKGALGDFGQAVADLVINPVRDATLFLFESIESALDKASKIPGIGSKFKDDKKAVSDIVDGLKDVNTEVENVGKSVVVTGNASNNMFSKFNDHVKETIDNTKSLVTEQQNYANSIRDTTFATAFQKITSGAEESTQSQIDFYKKLLDGSARAEKQIKFLGLSRAEVQRKLYLSEQDQVKKLTTGPLAELQKAYKALALNGNITPRFNRASLNTINANIRAFQQEKRDIRALGLPKDQEKKLISQANAAIAKMRALVEKRPVIVRFKIAGDTVRGFSDKKQLVRAFLGTDDVPGALRKALDDPRLVKQLSDSQRAILQNARAQAEAQGAGGNKDFILTNIADQLREATASKSDKLRIKKTAFGLGQDVATGLADGAATTSPIVRQAAVQNANAYLFGLNSVFEFGSPSKKTIELGRDVDQGLADGINAFAILPMTAAFNAGRKVMHMYALGITVGTAEVVAATLHVVTAASNVLSNVGYATALAAGIRYMDGFKSGIMSGFGTPKDKGSVAWYLNVFIPEWIRNNKGPIAYDATILVPAGEAVMQGFGRGLRSGFSQIQSFVKDVGPSLSEFISTDAFSGRTATVMADIAVGKTPDIDGVFGDIREQMAAAAFFGGGGISDPRLMSLHKTLSLADTAQMADTLAKTFGLSVTALKYDHNKYTASGNISDHYEGVAADLSNSSGGGDDPNSNTPQMGALAAAIKPLFGSIFKQIIYQNKDINQGFHVGGHQNHVHAAWLKGEGFDLLSGKKGEPAGFDFPDAPADVDAAIAYAAAKTKLDPLLIAAVMKQESGFRKNVVSFDGGYGLMQLTSQSLVDAADRIGGRFDPKANALIGSKYLADLISQLGSVPLGLSAYNSGPAGGEQSGSVDVPQYVSSVLGFLNEFKKKFGGAREHGGPVNANVPYLVGEKGPELMMPRTKGTIVNARDTAAMMSTPMGRTYNDNRQITLQTNATQPAAIIGYLKAHTSDDLAGMAWL